MSTLTPRDRPSIANWDARIVEPDAVLLSRVMAGDAVAARELYDAHAHRVYSTISRLMADQTLAGDVAQEVWVSVFRNLPSFRGDSRFSLWVHRIAVNGALYAQRSASKRRGRELELLDVHVVAPTQEREANNAVARGAIEGALRALPEGMRSVIVLHDVDGLTHEEIAAALDIAPGTSKSQLFKARARMRQLLGEGMNPEDESVTSPR